MKQIIAFLLFLAIFTPAILAQSEIDAGDEVRVSAVVLWPQAGEPWTHAEGGEIQWARWVNSNFGWALALGLQHWKASYEGDDTYVDPTSGFPVPMHHEVSGYALNVPMGGSLLGRLPAGPFSITGELGLRFVPVISEVTYAVTTPNPLNPMEPVTLKQTVKIRPPIIAVAGFDVEYPMNDKYSLFVGGGYQYDLLQPEIEIDTMGQGTRTESNQMKAWFARVGCTVRF